jgi:hypothetical protein
MRHYFFINLIGPPSGPPTRGRRSLRGGRPGRQRFGPKGALGPQAPSLRRSSLEKGRGLTTVGPLVAQVQGEIENKKGGTQGGKVKGSTGDEPGMNRGGPRPRYDPRAPRPGAVGPYGGCPLEDQGLR